jgi:hypothetical protein
MKWHPVQFHPFGVGFSKHHILQKSHPFGIGKTMICPKKTWKIRLNRAIMPPMQNNLRFANNNDNDNDAVRGVGRSFAG